MIELARLKRVLAFFAHPDDETLAAGATISKLSGMGVEVHIALPATGVLSRRMSLTKAELQKDLGKLRENCAQALSILGVPRDHIYLGELPDNELDKHSLLELIHWVEEIMRRVGPELVLTHHRYSTNIDHQYCHEAAIDAARPSPGRQIALYAGEVPSSTGYLRPAQWEPNFYVGITKDDLARKVQAMAAYEGESRPDPHPRPAEVIRALAKVRGSESGFLWAEAFMIHRVFG